MLISSFSQSWVEVTPLLLAHPNVHVNIRDKVGILYMIECCFLYFCRYTARILLTGPSLLHLSIIIYLSIFTAYIHIVRLFQHGWTALMWAADGRTESVKQLLTFSDINVNLRDQVRAYCNFSLCIVMPYDASVL